MDKYRLYLFLLLLVFGNGVHSQELSFTPDVVFGNRSMTYKHLLIYHLDSKLSLDNLTLFDTEYEGDTNTIYFIRNNVSYKLSEKTRVNTSVGIKNPGAFGSLSLSFFSRTPHFSANYTAGGTYQDGVSFEQSLVISYYPNLGRNHQAYINILATGNLSSKGYIRGLQQFKLGIRKEKLITGLALNLDQFNNSRKKLKNTGIFFKYNF